MNTIQRIILLVILIVLPTALSAKGVEIKGKSADVEKAAAEKGLLVLTAGEHVVRLLPPLVITMDEINKGLEVLKACL